jgi:acyl-coenzyme A thioesterase PaaI-like protein
MDDATKALQDIYAPGSVCYGCGPSNAKGFHIKSRVGDPVAGGPVDWAREVLCDWSPEPHHIAYAGSLNGGVIGTLLDCHCNWTATWHLMRKNGLEAPPCTVTAEYSIKLLRPTPARALRLRARVVELSERKAVVEGVLEVDGEACATCRGVFVAVKEGHPAFHRW